MMVQLKPRTPKGMRDFLPDDLLKREYVIHTVTDVFQTFGFEPLQTPVLELRETLHGNLGEDAEKQIFYAQHPNAKEELALRYDLTVPLARVVAQYEGQINLPFKRYHIDRVWRSDRPQRGRYREFYQCDVDIVGVAGVIADAEVIAVAVTALRRLGFGGFEMRINNRKILSGIGEYAGIPANLRADLYRSVDKLDKIGLDGVRKELAASGIPSEATERMAALLQLRGSGGGGRAALAHLRETLDGIETAQQGIGELEELLGHLDALGLPQDNYAIDFALVRGLGYYTGPVYEAISSDPGIGSLCGGGRYDNLIGMFRKQSLPTTGISLGIERIIDLMDELNLYPANLNRTVVQVFVTVFGDDTRAAAQRFAMKLREAGIRTELHLQDRSVGKQTAYADRKGIPVVAYLGTEEIAAGMVNFKRLHDGAERRVPQDEAAEAVRALLA